MRNQKKIFFEKIQFFHYPFIIYFLLMDYEVSVFDFGYDLKQKFWLRRWINNEKIRRIYVGAFAKGRGEAIDQTELVYPKLKKTAHETAISLLYESHDISPIFKKTLVTNFFQTLFIYYYFKDLRTEESQKLIFIPHSYFLYADLISKYGSLSSQIIKRVKTPKWTLFVSRVVRGAEKLFYLAGGCLYLFSKILLLLFGKGINPRSVPPKKYTYAVAIHQPFDVRFVQGRSFDFIIDNKNITLENTLFLLCMPTSEEWTRAYQKEGYQFLHVKKITGLHGLLQPRCSGKALMKSLFSLLRVPLLAGSILPFGLTHLRCINVYINQKLIFGRATFKHYIYRNQESANQMAINILVRKQGGEAWDYAYSIGGGYLYTKGVHEFYQRRDDYWAYLNSDHFLVVNGYFSEYHRLHLQGVGQYHEIGSIYAEMVREALEKVEKKSVVQEYFGNRWKNEGKIVTFFDTTYIDDEECDTTFDDAIFFYKDILRLLEERKNLFCIIKPSKDEDYYVGATAQWSSMQKGRQIIHLWRTLRSHPRVYWAGNKGDSPLIMAVSDLVITHAASSPTADALGIRKKAFWYQSKVRKNDFMFDSIHGLTVYGYALLREKIDYLLEKVDDREYNEYLDKYVKGKVDPYLDGFALKRFRELLVAAI